ncbi:MAG: carbamoyltransferase HypF [Actinobacteria bacterium]|nr:MAG: carbamoyltransferase HypF [Actinomycetota bacterium]
MNTRLHILVKGIVQGVGFRPFIYNLARSAGLAGWVLNSSEGVHIEVQGPRGAIEQFTRDIREKAPAMARIESLQTEELSSEAIDGFVIRRSEEQEGAYQLVSPDISICEDCLGELFDPADRRYQYPFINCTNCGPRFTIIEDIPYDRPKTTMRSFEMCEDCRREYEDPANRRFHAQPNACPVCGPSVRFVRPHPPDDTKLAGDPIESTVKALQAGEIVAVKGLGGFHLACDALNEEAVLRLRERKQRYGKPLAVMMEDIPTIEGYCRVGERERALLSGPQRPIVLLEKVRDVAPSVAPKNNHLGVMLPYTPLHYVILRRSKMVLVMTSGNLSEEPIAMENEEGLARLSAIADAFLLHDREIYSRYDDSVLRVVHGETQFIRRARGYAPFPIRLPRPARQILAVGPEQKNTFCLTKEGYAFVSQHIGDMENAETLEHFANTLALYERLFRVEPEIVAYDLHPEYLSTKYASELELPKVGVQHHHAHAAACMIEHDEAGPVIGVSLDGTGYGTDGSLWGGEFLLATLDGFERAAHLRYVPMPGGSAAIKNPYRMAFAYLYHLLGAGALDSKAPLLERIGEREQRLMRQMIDRSVNSPLTSSMGRLFDAVSALCGVRDVADYEGQAAIELEAFADENLEGAYAFDLLPAQPAPCGPLSKAAGERPAESPLLIDPAGLMETVLLETEKGTSISTISTRFHNGVALLVLEVCDSIERRSRIETVTLSGGVFQNAYLLKQTTRLLREAGFRVLLHREVPPNDGCISLGQAAIAEARHPQ